MFGPELHVSNATNDIWLCPIDYDDLPQEVDPQITQYLTEHFKNFVTGLPEQYEWLRKAPDNLHWGIYDTSKAALLGITGIRNLGKEDQPAISRIALFNDNLRGKGVGGLAYSGQYEYLKTAQVAQCFEHAADNRNIGSLRIAEHVGFTAIHDDGVRTTMHLRI